MAVNLFWLNLENGEIIPSPTRPKNTVKVVYYNIEGVGECESTIPAIKRMMVGLTSEVMVSPNSLDSTYTNITSYAPANIN